MEIRKINLHQQVLYLGKIIKKSEKIENNNISNDSNNQILYNFSYDDQINKKLIIFELRYSDNFSFKTQNIKYIIKYKEDIGYSYIHLIAKGNINNKIYLLFRDNYYSYDIYAGIYDIEINNYFPIIIDNSKDNIKLKNIIKQIPDKDYITILEQNKIFFFGGLIEQNNRNNQSIINEEKTKTDSSRNIHIINKSCIYFDLEKLDFEKQNFYENSLAPRYKLGGTSQQELIYLIGGFTSIPNNEDNICNLVQFSKYTDDKMHQFSAAKFDGESPKYMIDNQVFVVNNKFLISFSAYNNANLWILDIEKNKGININLKDKINLEEYNQNNLSLILIDCDINEKFNDKKNININLIIAKIIYNENQNDIKFEIINKSFPINIE